jgi:hypothetical protein
MAVVSALLAGYAGASYAATGVASGAAGPTDTEPPPTTTTPAPAPDPAPPPAPKPAPKPAPHPATVYHAPVTPTPTYTPPTPTRVTPHATPKVVHRKHKRHKTRAKQITPAPKPKPKAQVEGASIVKIAGVSATVETNQPNTVRRAFVISGIGLAALLFLLVVSVPATAMRFTAAGRVVMDHQTDLVLAGIATLLLTALLFAITGIGS